MDELYLFMKNDRFISRAAVFETEPADAPRGKKDSSISENLTAINCHLHSPSGDKEEEENCMVQSHVKC